MVILSRPAEAAHQNSSIFLSIPARMFHHCNLNFCLRWEFDVFLPNVRMSTLEKVNENMLPQSRPNDKARFRISDVRV